MHHEPTRVQIEQAENAVLELRYFDAPGSNCYRSWKLTVDEAADLAEWWTSQGQYICRRHLPVRNLRVGCVLISMVTLETIEVRGLDARARPKLQGCSLPREVVEFLSKRMAEKQRSRTLPPQEVAEACSRESS